MQDDETARRARSFEAGAADYERLRPAFPEALFASIRDRAGHRLAGRVLEVGAGTGRATLPLLRLGAAIDVVEPSADMLGVLSGRLDAEGLGDRVDLRRATFEDVDPRARYDLVIAAQSFHWTDPATRWSRLGSLIRPDGLAFLFWDGWSLNPAVHDIAAVEGLYQASAGGLQPDTEDHRSGPSWGESEIEAAPDVHLADTTRYDWDWRLPIQDYLGLLMTTSQYAVADPAVRRRIFTALADILGTHVELNGRTLSLVVSPAAGEEALTGGNTTVVHRVGDTVRRPTGPWTPAVHRLLHHLATIGFSGAPRVIGLDESGREMLEYVDGEVGTLSTERPLPSWFRTPEACRAIGRWIRAFQTAQTGLVVDPTEPWRRAPGARLSPGQVIVHHDVSPYNTVRRPDGSLVVLDWDFARPGDPIEEVAWAAWRWAPLMAGARWHDEYGVHADEDVEERQCRNLAALLDGYRPSRDQRRALADAIHDQMLRHASDLEDMARDDPAFAVLVERGFARAARADAAWWAAHRSRPRWRAAIGAPA